MNSTKAVVVVAMTLLVLGLVSPAHSDFNVTYPDGDVAFEVNLGVGQHLAAFWNLSGNGDISMYQADAVSNPLAVSLFGSPQALAYWLQFLGFDAVGHRVFNVFVSQGVGFFFVTRIAL